jgi:microcystin degradation protein MlrC
MKPLRIAYARIAQETNALSPLRTELADFERVHLLEGAALGAVCAPGQVEAKGFLKNAELSGFIKGCAQSDAAIETLPLISAWAVPAGRLSRQCFTYLADRLIALVEQAGALDGLYLCLHGAMRTEDFIDPEGELLKRLRAVVGDALPIVISVDLHAVMTPEMVRLSSAICAYRTNPHRDHKTVGKRSAELLIRFIRGSAQPRVAWRSLPMLLGGGITIDFLAPMRSIFARMKEMERDPRVLYVSFLMSQPWHDHPDLGWATYVVTDDDPDLADTLADELAELAWAVKDIPPPAFASAIEAIETARKAVFARRLGAVFFCDISDVVTAGSVGENTHIISALINHAKGLTCLCALRDERAVARLFDLPERSAVSLEVGGQFDPALQPPLQLDGVLTFAGETTGFGRAVVVRQGQVTVCITEASPAVMKPAFYQELGLSVFNADIVVVKNFFPWRLFCAAYNRKTINIQTRGITDLDAAKVLEFNDPLHPFEEVEDWRDTDRKRRSGDHMVLSSEYSP